jgi:hypothetical protein
MQEEDLTSPFAVDDTVFVGVFCVHPEDKKELWAFFKAQVQVHYESQTNSKIKFRVVLDGVYQHRVAYIGEAPEIPYVLFTRGGNPT